MSVTEYVVFFHFFFLEEKYLVNALFLFHAATDTNTSLVLVSVVPSRLVAATSLMFPGSFVLDT
jgi:hypothetical protein